VNGLLVDPQDGETPLDVPVEGRVLEVNDDSAILAVADGAFAGQVDLSDDLSAESHALVSETSSLVGCVPEFLVAYDYGMGGLWALPVPNPL
jgi:hypothetical protein